MTPAPLPNCSQRLLQSLAIAFDEIDSWAQWVVLAGILVTVIGFMIAVSPNRRGA